MKTDRLLEVVKAQHFEWRELYHFSNLNYETDLRIDRRGRLHLIRRETLLDGKRFEPDADIEGLMHDAGIGWKTDRHGVLITDTLITPLEAAKLCLEDFFPDDLLKFVHVHA